MKEVDHQHVDRKPGRVEQREDADARKKAAQRGDVAQSVNVRCMARHTGACEQVGQHAGAEEPIEGKAGTGEQARPQDIQQQHEPEGTDGPRGEHRQGRVAAGSQYAIEDLHHVQRRRQHQDVDDEAEEPGVQEVGPEAGEQRMHGAGRTEGDREAWARAGWDRRGAQRVTARRVVVATRKYWWNMGLLPFWAYLVAGRGGDALWRV